MPCSHAKLKKLLWRRQSSRTSDCWRVVVAGHNPKRRAVERWLLLWLRMCREKHSLTFSWRELSSLAASLKKVQGKTGDYRGKKRVSEVEHQALTLLEFIYSFCTFPCWNSNLGQVVNISILTGNPLTLWKVFRISHQRQWHLSLVCSKW